LLIIISFLISLQLPNLGMIKQTKTNVQVVEKMRLQILGDNLATIINSPDLIFHVCHVEKINKCNWFAVTTNYLIQGTSWACILSQYKRILYTLGSHTDLGSFSLIILPLSTALISRNKKKAKIAQICMLSINQHNKMEVWIGRRWKLKRPNASIQPKIILDTNMTWLVRHTHAWNTMLQVGN